MIINQANSQPDKAFPDAGDAGLARPDNGKDNWPFCAIRGRMIPRTACLDRLRAFCRANGLAGPLDTIIHNAPDDRLSFSDPGNRHRLIVLTCRIPYEPSWGGRGGLPRPLLLEKAISAEPETTSHAIAPYLRLYRSAGRRILLSREYSGDHTIALPRDLIADGNRAKAIGLYLDPAKLVAADRSGNHACLSWSGPYNTYRASEGLVAALTAQNFQWFDDRPTPIGTCLSETMFRFETAPALRAANPFAETLLPLMPRIVTDTTPHLRAAEIYLQALFTDCSKQIFKADAQTNRKRDLLVAALTIDMRGFGDHREQYLIPWQACLPATDHETVIVIPQDDLINGIGGPTALVR
jgi:hypothetical protein